MSLLIDENHLVERLIHMALLTDFTGNTDLRVMELHVIERNKRRRAQSMEIIEIKQINVNQKLLAFIANKHFTLEIEQQRAFIFYFFYNK